MIQKKTIEKYTEMFNAIKDSGLSINGYLKSIGKDPKGCGFYCAISNIKRQAEEGDENAKNLISIYQSLVNRPVSNNIVEDERGMSWWVDRDPNNIITQYHIHYPVKDSTPFDTTLTRQDAETIFGLYTYYGGNITARNVANEFPKYTLTEIKRIFRVFKLTKDSIFAPPHLMEELNEEQLSQYRMHLKEKAAFKYCDAKMERDFTNQIKKMASEINQLSDVQNTVKTLLDPIEYEKVLIKPKTETNYLTGIICLSDLHVGAYNTPEGYLNMPESNEAEINRRFDKIIKELRHKRWERVVVLNLGDSIDSYRKMTTSMTHQLPCIYSDREIATMYMRIMLRFFNQLSQIFNKVEYCSIGSGNHSGDYGWLCDIALSQQLSNIGVSAYVSNNEIDNININNISFIFLHGKAQANKGQFKGFPLNLNEKTQCWFNDFFADTDLNLLENKVVLKGDLHQFSINSVSSFDYINCPSLYGSSTYIVSNFGYTKWGCAYIEVDNYHNYTTGIIKD